MQTKIVNLFLRHTIVIKILAGYLALAALILAISFLSLSNLDKLNRINTGIVQQDIPIAKTAEEMIGNLFEQELYARRFVILNSPEILKLFQDKSRDFQTMARVIRDHSVEYIDKVDRILSLHAEYISLVVQKPSPLPPAAYEEQMKQQQDQIVAFIKDIYKRAKDSEHEKMLLAEKIGTRAVKEAVILCAAGIIFGLGAALLMTRNISRSITQLKQATEEISSGRFEYAAPIHNKNEFGDLFLAFKEMALKLKRLEETHLDASPLTYLPGGNAIEKEFKRRVAEGSRVGFCFVDLDNFKSFNDHCGYARGSEVIKASARIIEEVIAAMGTPMDFVGHIGGDDFVFITDIERYEKICNEIIGKFNRMITTFYPPADVKQGYITGKNRQGQETQFPIMTISIAVVLNQKDRISDAIQIGEIAKELKEYAKSIPGSLFITDRRYEQAQTEQKKSLASPDRGFVKGKEC